MLQVITGKFFQSEERHTSEEKAVLYSNYRWFAPIETCVGRLEPLDRRGALTTYLFSFLNQLEKEKGNFSVVSIGNGEIIEQFRLLCVFGLKAVFAEDRSWAAHLCRSGTTGQAQDSIPSQILARYFSSRIDGRNNDGPEFSAFVAKVLSVPRSDYKSIVSALQAFSGALDVVGTSLDLAYSMLVYALEALAQKHMPYQPRWNDFDERERSALDPILATLPSQTSIEIQSALLRGAHLKNKQRFADFVCAHVHETYFTSEAAAVKSPLLHAEVQRAVRNIYEIRSAYVHELRPLMHQIRVPELADGDVFRWNHEPHLTFNGLVRLFQHVVRQFVEKRPSLEKESINWRGDLPGVVQLKWAPQYWIHKADGFSAARSPDYFRGFIDNLLDAMREGGPVCDMSSVMDRIEQIAMLGSLEQRRAMVALYALYNGCVHSDLRRTGWREFLASQSVIADSSCIEMMATCVLVGSNFPWTLEEAEQALQQYAEERFHRGRTRLPAIVETAIIVAMANLALDRGQAEKRHTLLKKARLNSAGLPDLQGALEKASDRAEKLSLELVLPRKAGGD